MWDLVRMRMCLWKCLSDLVKNKPERMSYVTVTTPVKRVMVVGLGNPGMDSSRHSVGMTALGLLAERLNVSQSWRIDKCVSGLVTHIDVDNVGVLLLRPTLLMNVNGVSVAKAATKFHIQPKDIILVHDDLEKPLGKFGMKKGGSARGHNGVRSCVECLQTDVMPRLRIGIGRPPEKVSVERHVLGRFTMEEKKLLVPVLQQCVDLLMSQLKASHTQASHTPPRGSRNPAKRTLSSPQIDKETVTPAQMGAGDALHSIK